MNEAEKLADKWEGAEEWMPLAWELCANECGEDACTELVWEGGPIPEPWGDRWLKYEDQAKEMIAMVRKYVPQDAALIRRQAEQIKLLREALARLLSSDPEGAIATASEDDLTEAANDASADPVVREQAASVLQARSVLAATKEET